ncbi:ring-cleaving dioxygenase, partial [Salmonella enterica subsp. enterica]|nr:ring-cleaving dioxygenase [Salmonella enterica subsp. enterica serovar Paratyphi A]
MDLSGIHHLTAISANAPANKRFYTDTMGMRMVKKTVNQDDTSAYHLFYADGKATPGTDLTFFDWPAQPERRGTHSISRTGLRVAEPSLDYWAGRLADAKLTRGDIVTLDGRATLDFEDPEGQRFRLTADNSGAANPWAKSPVPAEHQVRGLGPITISVP